MASPTKKLRLVHQSKPTLAVCRLDAKAKVPSWLDVNSTTHSFYSITRTFEELSIVCDQILVPPINTSSSTAVQIECDWTSLKVQGPLDFGLTGILNKLTTPLAHAKIPIYAISTYDTDYVLIKNDKMQQAIQMLRDSEQCEIVADNASFTAARPPPDSGTAPVFEADKLVRKLVETDKVSTPTFGVVVTGLWPPSDAVQTKYNEFRNAVAACFENADLTGAYPNVYLYSAAALHVTVATFCRINQHTGAQYGDFMIKHARILLQRAQHRLDWPTTRPLQLQVDGARIGIRAGIILWKETSGSLQQIRHCLASVKNEYQVELDSMTGLMENERAAVMDMLHDFSIPDIVHSTFMRYYKVPLATDGVTLQQRFQQVAPKVAHFFPQQIVAARLSLACERTPYMHIPDDDDHIIARVLLE